MKRIISGLLTLALILSLCPMIPMDAKADIFSGSLGENLTWTVDDGGTLTISGNGDMCDDDQPWMDSGIMVTNIVIESGVTSIGSRSFAMNPDVISIVIPDTVERIGDYAFEFCNNLQTIEIPANVRYIGKGAFQDCHMLDGIWVNPDNCYYQSDRYGVLLDRSGFNLIAAPGGLMGDYVMPNGVKTIKEGAFSRCAVSTVTISAHVSKIEDYAFYWNNLTAIYVHKENVNFYNDEYGVLYNSSNSIVQVPANISEDYVIPDKVGVICKYAFNNCMMLTSVTIPDSVFYIQEYAFEGCMLESIYIGTGLDEVGDGAFVGNAPSDIYYKGTEEQWNEIWFGDYNWELMNATMHFEYTSHSHDYETIVTEPTCTTGGYTTYICDCGDSYDDDYTDRLGHSFTNYVSNKNATCTEDGTKTAKCDRCNATDTLDDANSKLGHSFTNYVSDKNATCTEDGTKTAKCDRCNATDTMDDTNSKLGHSFTNYISNNDATYEADGTKTAKCDRCDATDTVIDEGSKLTDKPMEITVVNGVEGVDVTWTANKNAAKYKVYQRYMSSGSWTGWVLVSTVKNQIFTHTAAKNGILYEYKVIAVDVAGAELETVSSATIMRLTAPSITLSNTASAIKLTLSSNSKAEAFRISRSEFVDGQWSQWIHIADATSTSYSDTTVIDGVVYRYMVQVVNGEYIGTENNVAELIRLESPAVEAENLDEGIALNWLPSKAEGVSYVVYRSQMNSGSWTSWTKLDTVTDTEYLDTTAVNAVQYRYMVRVTNGTVTSAAVSGTIIIRKTITGMEVTTLPKIKYTIGDELDLSGGIVTVYYSNNTTDAFALSELLVTGFDSKTVGVKTLTVAYKNVSCTYEVTVKEPVTMQNITVTNLPEKLIYSAGEGFDPAGLEVTLHYSDGTTETVTDYTIAGYDAAPGEKVITVTYLQFTVTFTVTVEKKTVAGIQVTKLPEKLSYVAGAQLDTTGMVVMAYYADGTEAQIVDYTFTVDLSTEGEQIVTVSYEGKTVTFVITVYPKATVEVLAQNGATGIEVTWTAQNAQKFKVYQSYFGSGVWSEWVLASSTATSKFVHTAAKNGLLYRYKVIAYQNDVIVNETETPEIMRLNSTEATAENVLSGLQVTWASNVKATAFQVYRCQLDGDVWTEWEQVAEVAENIYTDATAVNGTRYRYAVKTVCDTHISAMSEFVAVLRMDPATVNVQNVISGIRITWQENAAAAKYYVYRSEQNGSSWTEWTRLITTEATLYTDVTAKNGVMYRYMVRAVNNTQLSAGTSGTFIMRLALYAVSASNQTGGIKLSWTQNKSATSYNIYRSEEQNGVWTEWGKPILNTTETTFTDKTAVNGVKYRYMVRSLNGEYISGSKTGAILYRLDSPTVTIENFSAGIRINWTVNDAASKYFVYRSAYENGAWGSWEIFIKASAGTTKYEDYSVENGVRYRYMVRVYKGDNQSAGKASDPVRRITAITATVAAASDGIQVSWKANAAAGSYKIYRHSYNAATASYSDWELVGSTKELSFVDTTAIKGVTYRYTVRGVNGTDMGCVKASGNIRW